jgi:hypothetical protein
MEETKTTARRSAPASTKSGRKTAETGDSTARKPRAAAKAKSKTQAKTKTTAKPRATAKTTARRKSAAATRTTLTADDRRKLVEIAAYYRSERRGFVPGHEDEDWLAAEAEVDAHLAAIPKKRASKKAG